MTTPYVTALPCGCFFSGREFCADPGCAEHATYHQRAKEKRFIIYRDGKEHAVTRDYDHAQHVLRLLKADGHKDVVLSVLDGNQKGDN